MTTEPEINVEALEAGYKVELRQHDTEIVYVFISPQLVESESFQTAAEAWEGAYFDLKALSDPKESDI